MMTLREIPYETACLVFSEFISEFHHEKLNRYPFFFHFIPTERERMDDERLLFVVSEIHSFIYWFLQYRSSFDVYSEIDVFNDT